MYFNTIKLQQFSLITKFSSTYISSNSRYVSATPFTMFDGEHAIVKPNDKIYSIISKEGKQVEGLPDIVEIGTFEGESYIQSDYVDFKALIADCKISDDGMFGMSFKTTPAEAIKAQVKEGIAMSDENHKAGDLYWYDLTDEVWFIKKPGNIGSVEI